MKTVNLFLAASFFVTLIVVALLAQPPAIQWIHEFGWGYYYVGYSVKQSLDGGYILTGSERAAYTLADDILLVKTSSTGGLQWRRTFGEIYYDDWGTSIQQTTDGGYIIAVGCYQDCADLLKTDAAGTIVWSHTYAEPGGMAAKDVEQTSDGGYVLFGTTSSYGAGLSDFYLVKTDNMGDTLWTRTYGGIDYDYACSGQQTSDGGYIIVGTTRVMSPYIDDVFVAKTDSNGDTMWTRTYGGPDDEMVYSVEQTSDGGFVIGATTTSFGAGSSDMYIIKTDSLGDTLWTHTYGRENSEYYCTIHQTADGGFILGGTANAYSDSSGLYLVRTDERGDVLWTLIYSEEYSSTSILEIQLTNDQGYIAVGTTYYPQDYCNVCLIKIHPDTFIYHPEIQVSDTLLDFGIVPVTENSSQEFTITNTGNAWLVLYDLTTSDSSFTTDYDPADSLLAPHDSLVVFVTFSPRDTISYNEILIIDNNDVLTEIALLGIGIPPNSIVPEPLSKMPTTFELKPIYPNPFNAHATIQYHVSIGGLVCIDVYDVLGREVAHLVNGVMSTGSYRMVWNAGDLPSGIYFCRMQAGDFNQIQKILLLK